MLSSMSLLPLISTPPVRRTRRSYTAAFKLEVVKYAEENGGNMACHRQFGVSEKCVRDWRKAKDVLRMTKQTRKANRGHKNTEKKLEEKKPRFPTTMTISKAESELLREISTQRISPSPPASAPTIAEDFTVELVEHELEEEEEEEEQQLIISEHQHNVMASLASLWRNGRLCDAAIGNGTSKILVHKIVLLAICPRLLSMFSADVQANRFLQVNFPQRVSEQALSAFAEYMYNGVLRLTPRLLDQLRLIALQLGIKELELLCDANSVFSQNTRLTSVTHSSLSNSQPTGQFVRSVPVHHQRQSNLLHRQQQFLNPSSIDNQEIIVIPDSQEIIIEDQIPQQFCYSSLPLDVQETSYQASDAGIGNLIATSKQARSIKHDSIEEYRPEETIKIEHDDTDDEKYDQQRPTQMRGTLASVFNSLTNELITHITHPDQTEMNVSSSSHQHPHTPNFSSEKSSVNFPSAVSNRSQVQQKRLDRKQSLRDISIKNEDTGQQDSNQDYRHKVTPTDHNPDTHHLAKLAPFTLEKSMDLEMLPEPEVEFIQITDVRSGSRNSAIS